MKSSAYRRVFDWSEFFIKLLAFVFFLVMFILSAYYGIKYNFDTGFAAFMAITAGTSAGLAALAFLSLFLVGYKARYETYYNLYEELEELDRLTNTSQKEKSIYEKGD